MRSTLAAALASALLFVLAAGSPASGQALVGSFLVQDGPDWQVNPQSVSCLEACAIVFGGGASGYACSTSDSSIDHLAYLSGWGDETYCFTPAAEDYSLGTDYDCGSVGCSYSAYVDDHCEMGETNYCWLPACGDGVLDPGEACDDGNLAAGDCCSATCQLEASLGSCDDGDPCTQDSCGESGCANAAEPALICDEDVAKASLLLDAAKGKASFSWRKGSVPLAQLGDPTVATGYTLCLYGADTALARLEVPAGGTCSGKACWKGLGKAASPKGFAYKDKLAASDGVRSLTLKAHDAGKAKLALAAKGGDLPPLDLGPTGLTAPVTAQLRNDDGMCWGARFQSSDARKSDANVFKATHKNVP
jgi:cysteine-rich repeat protein